MSESSESLKFIFQRFEGIYNKKLNFFSLIINKLYLNFIITKKKNLISINIIIFFLINFL